MASKKRTHICAILDFVYPRSPKVKKKRDHIQRDQKVDLYTHSKCFDIFLSTFLSTFTPARRTFVRLRVVNLDSHLNLFLVTRKPKFSLYLELVTGLEPVNWCNIADLIGKLRIVLRSNTLIS